MKKYVVPVLLLSTGIALPAHADNMVDCEVAVMDSVLDTDKAEGKKTVSFHPAAAFISSVYEDEGRIEDHVDGKPIRAVLCKRRDILPVLRDFPVIATGIPFSVSDNFDSPDGRMISILFKDGEFVHKFVGAKLTEKEQTALSDVMEVYNLQPHELGGK